MRRGPPIRDQITSNQRRALILLASFVAVVVLVGALLGAPVGNPLAAGAVALVAALAVAACSYFYSDRIALALSQARPASAAEHPRYHNLVEGLCISAGLPKPALFVIPDEAPNAFSAGRSPAHASVVVTTGLLDKLSRVELEGVLAHELAHIRNGDILVTSVAVTMVGGLALLLPLAPVSARLLRLAVSRRREAAADATGVRITRYPPGLISALEKLRSDRTVVRSGSRATAHLWIEFPLDRADGAKSAWANRLFDLGPPLEERIAALRDL